MATGAENRKTLPYPAPQSPQQGLPPANANVNANANTEAPISPPTKRELVSWWKKFRKTTEKEEEKVIPVPGIFGVPLAESIRYANVAISLTNDEGESFIYGYVPIVVAKCGVFLKEKATDVEGIFRLSGSAKRIKDLQTIFNSPDRYGKGLDWTGYTVHDAANILRRYLNQLPEPIVPLHQYERFRDPLRSYQQRLENHPEGQAPEISATEHAVAVTAYQKLITELPALNRQLLLYILDLLAVFSSKSDLNRMNAANLALIFQPGIISHPVHDMAPQEYRLSQDVLIFLIENQDNFLIGMTGTAVDEKTQKDVESGPPPAQTPKMNANANASINTNANANATLGRSASNASGGADSLRKYGIRRNVSTSSRASRDRVSPNVSGPGTPISPSYASTSGSIGVARSNTVPSKRSPAIGQHRFQRVADSSTPDSPTVTAVSPQTEPAPADVEQDISPTTKLRPQTDQIGIALTSPNPDTPARENVNVRNAQRRPEGNVSPFPEIPNATPSEVLQTNPVTYTTTSNIQTTNLQLPKTQVTAASPQTRERKISNLFAKSPKIGPSEASQGQGARQPRKLQKRTKLPGQLSESAQSSAASLQGEESLQSPILSPVQPHAPADPVGTLNQGAVNASPHPVTTQENEFPAPPYAQDIQGRGSTAPRSPAISLRSGTSMTDPSDFDALDDPVVKAEKKQSRWRIASPARRVDDGPLMPPPPIGYMPGARTSNSSIGSSRGARQSFTAESSLHQQFGNESSSTGQPSVVGPSSHESNELLKEAVPEAEKKGLFGKWKAKITQSKEERREREAEKERAKSPQRMTGDNVSSRQSLSAIAHDHFTPRGRSFDKPREDSVHGVNQQPRTELVSTNPANNAASVSVPNPALAPQTASVTGHTSAPNSIPTNTTGEEPVVDRAEPTGTGGNPGPAVPAMPVVKEEAALEIDTQPQEMMEPSSVQHTPTEVKSPPLDKR